MKNLSILIIVLFIHLSSAASKQPIKANKEIVAKTISITQKHICNPAFLETKEWSTFMNYVSSDEVLALDEYAFAKAFNKAADALPFSHFYIKPTPRYAKKLRRKKKKNGKNQILKPYFELTEIDNKTVVLSVRAFVLNATLMKKLTAEILEKGYDNLIIDVRNNSGGTLDAPVILGQFLSKEMIDAGSYINRSWFEEHKRYPTMDEINTFPFLKEMTYQGFQKAAQNPAFRMVLPSHNKPIFKGKVFVLTNGQTASACEPFVHLLKEAGVATIVGEATAGEMLSGATFSINRRLNLFLPVQDYITANGTKIDQVGITPDIEVSSEEALQTVLNSLK